jgi:MFS transporter, ACS family, hexuronate transporter
MKLLGQDLPQANGEFINTRQYRWIICFLLFLITVNNYMDRQMLSIVIPTISTQFHLSASDIAFIINAFLLMYGLGQLFSGRFMDWIGARRGITISVLLWSLASIFTSIARTAFGFGFFRLLLGTAESGNFSAGVKVLSELFPSKERTTAVGFFASGTSIGALLTPPIGAYLIVHHGWQFAFVAVGIPGLAWIFAWRALYKPAKSHVVEAIEPNPAAAIESADTNTVARDEAFANSRRWSFLVRQRLVWSLIIGRFVEEPAGWFFFSWLPFYLKNFHSTTLIHIGLLLTIPFFALDMGFLAGGWAASRLIKKGWSIDKTRRMLIGLSAVCMMATLLAIETKTAVGFVLLVSVATFGHGSWSSNIMAMPGDILPHRSVATLYGMTAACGALGSILFMIITGKLIDIQHSFNTVFAIAGILPLVAWILMFTVGGKVQRLPSLASY